jgi:predicted lipoprotein with Yx(FWY)xxD motif
VKRTYVLLVSVLLAALTASAIESGVPSAHAVSFRSVYLRKTKLGKILVNTAGTTLSEFSKDPPKTDTCVKHAGCTTNWIPQEESGKPTAGPGVRASLLSTIEVKALGERQLTYAGHPLYIDAGATGPGQTSSVGTKEFGGTWDAINAKGRAVK